MRIKELSITAFVILNIVLVIASAHAQNSKNEAGQKIAALSTACVAWEAAKTQENLKDDDVALNDSLAIAGANCFNPGAPIDRWISKYHEEGWGDPIVGDSGQLIVRLEWRRRGIQIVKDLVGQCLVWMAQDLNKRRFRCLVAATELISKQNGFWQEPRPQM